MAQNLDEQVTREGGLEQAYFEELQMAFYNASGLKDQQPVQMNRRMNRINFKQAVHSCLGTRSTNLRSSNLWCNIMGFWLPPGYVKCAHIVPFSWNIRDMAHMFGSDEPPLTSPRNGLSLQTDLEMAFDRCDIAVVPDGSEKSTPTKWKVVVLNPAVMEDVFFNDEFLFTDRPTWKYADIGGRPLSFVNDVRPAVRFLYLRYALA